MRALESDLSSSKERGLSSRQAAGEQRFPGMSTDRCRPGRVRPPQHVRPCGRSGVSFVASKLSVFWAATACGSSRGVVRAAFLPDVEGQR